MRGKVKECYHCKQKVSDWKTHDCWTTTEEALTKGLSEDLMDAWLRLRETATEFGDQRIYASHKSIMFARTHCYFYVRPKPKFLEVCFFLGRPEKRPPIKKVLPSSKVKYFHLVQVRHRDEVEAPLSDWLQEAYEVSEALKSAGKARAAKKPSPKKSPRPKKKSRTRASA